MKRRIASALIGAVVLAALLLSPILGMSDVSAKKTGPGYTSPPRCCTAEECQRPAKYWPMPKGVVRVQPVVQPGLIK